MTKKTLPNVVTRKSIINLIIVNLSTVIAAILFQWPLLLLVWPFFIQNLVIGYFSRQRILALKNFNTVGFTINDRAVKPTVETQRKTANFFTLHFGVFHLGYFLFLTSSSSMIAPLDWLLLGVTALAFIWNHRDSYLQHLKSDSQGCPNIGMLMFLPYLRVVPMHIIIVTGLSSNTAGAYALLIFGALKTIADVAMHYVEHRSLAGVSKNK